MKYIIDIDERRFKDIQRIASIQIRRRDLTCEQIIANGIPLEDIKEQYIKGYKDGVKETFIEELEKMWEKIRALPDINPDYPMDKTIHISRYEVQKIIYEHISELKGENK